jgi:hypothetical protein
LPPCRRPRRRRFFRSGSTVPRSTVSRSAGHRARATDKAYRGYASRATAARSSRVTRPFVVPSGLVINQGWKRDSKKRRTAAVVGPFRVLASAQTACHCGHCGRLDSARHDCRKAGQAAARSSSLQPGRSLQRAAWSGLLAVAGGMAAPAAAHCGQTGQLAGAGHAPPASSLVVPQPLSSTASSVTRIGSKRRGWLLCMVWLECRVRQPAKYTVR